MVQVSCETSSITIFPGNSIKMEDYFEGFSEEITKWENFKEMVDLDLDDELQQEHKIVPSDQLLPRQDVFLYGTIPKMEQRVYTKCKECRLVFNPRDILSHKICPGKSHSSSHSLKKKVKSKGSSSKKSHSNKKPPSPATASTPASAAIPELAQPKVSSPKPSKTSTVSSTPSTHTTTTTSSSHSKSETRVSSSSSSSKHSSHSHRSPTKHTSDHSPKSKTATTTETSSSSRSSSSSSRHRKSRKSNSNTKITKEFDPDVHCGVVEGNRGPCTRSITCSSHRIQLRKLVPGRSKDIHQLIAERKTAKEKESKHGSNCSYTSPNGQAEEKDSFSQNTTYVPFVAAVVSTSESSDKTSYKPIMPKPSDSSTHSRQTTTSVLTAKQPTSTDSEIAPSKTIDNNYIMNMHSQESAIGTVPVVYMPMSPISVVSPVQFVQIGKNVICLESPQSAMSPPVTSNRSLYLSIPKNNSNMEIYKSHPKPVAVPNYGTKKVGGAILLSNQHVECQRNDILMAINSTRKIVNNTHRYRAVSLLNHTNMQHRPNILKVKSANRVNCKRSAIDKLNTSDSKQIRLTAHVNGLNSDISESAEAPQSNCIQEKIALLNMK